MGLFTMPPRASAFAYPPSLIAMARGRMRAAVFLAVVVMICGCQQNELRRMERDLDHLAAHPRLQHEPLKSAALPRNPETSTPYTLEHLLELAASGASLVLRAQLASYETELKVNETSSKLLPRLDLRPGYDQLIFQPKNSSAEGFNVPVIVDWNLLSYWQRQRELLVYLKGKEASVLALQLAKKEAKTATAGFYYEHWILREALSVSNLHQEHAERLFADAQFLHKQGAISEIILLETERERSRWRNLAEAQTQLVVQSEKRLQEFLALPQHARFAAPSNAAFVQGTPTPARTLEACILNSESSAIAALRVEMAEDAAKAAKLIRWAQFGTTVSVLGLSGNGAGLIGGSIFWLLPILDRNEQQRSVLAARIQLVNAMISRSESAPQFRQMVSDLTAQISDRQRQLTIAASAAADEKKRHLLTRQRHTEGNASERAVQEQQLQRAEKESAVVRLQYELAASQSKLAYMCS